MRKGLLILWFGLMCVWNVAHAQAFIEVTPQTLQPVEVQLGNTTTFDTLHIRQGNLHAETTFYIGGHNADQFSLSASSLPADQSELDLIVTYAPTRVGKHTAAVVFDNIEHPGILPGIISLNATCIDTLHRPKITTSPTSLPGFEAVSGRTVTQTISVTSENCVDYVYLRVNHIQGTAFTIDASMLSKNSTADVTIRFSPPEPGRYQSTITLSTAYADSLVLTLNGHARRATKDDIDWQTDFVWDTSSPLAQLNETFDSVGHNTTLLLDGWQNIAEVEARPWWSFDNCAKATAYQYGKDSTALWTMWLVTPALDYRNALSQVFRFSVMGQYMPERDINASLQLYYVEVRNSQDVHFIPIEVPIPANDEENNEWVPCEVHLENQTGIADAFFMAFRYEGPNGRNGAVTYYIDNVSWGIDPGEGIHPTGDGNNPARKILRNGQVLILRNGKEYTLLGLPF